MEVLATDDDDRSKGNGPSFTFRMDPNAQDVIRASFKVNSKVPHLEIANKVKLLGELKTSIK